MPGDDKDKKTKPKNNEDWPKQFSGHIIYDKNGVQVLRAVGKDLPFEIVVKDGVKKIMPSDTDPEKIDFEKLPELNLKDYEANVNALQGGEGDTTPKVKTTTIKIKPNFDAWGDLATQAQDEGWYPSVDNKGEVEYRNGYQNQFNQVVIPNDQKRGYISVVGRKGSPLSVYIKKADGTIDRTLLKNVSPQQVDDYFRSQGGTIQKRHDSIVAGTNIDRIMPDGNITQLQ